MDRIGKEHLTYWLSNYSEQDGKEFIAVNIQGDELCAIGLLQVNDWKNIEGIKSTKGVSYIGAQLKSLTFDILTKGDSIDFIYKNLERIIDENNESATVTISNAGNTKTETALLLNRQSHRIFATIKHGALYVKAKNHAA